MGPARPYGGTLRVKPAAHAIGSDELWLASCGSGGQKRFPPRTRPLSRGIKHPNEKFLSGNLQPDVVANKGGLGLSNQQITQRRIAGYGHDFERQQNHFSAYFPSGTTM